MARTLTTLHFTLLAAGWLVACTHTAAIGTGSTPSEPHRAPDEVLTVELALDQSYRVEVFVDAPEASTKVLLRVIGPTGEAWTSPIYPGWKVSRARLSRDEPERIVLGVWSTRARHDEPEPHRTVWVLGWEKGALVELHRGSALAHPLADFTIDVGAGEGPDELVATHWRPESPDERFERRYTWTGFGWVASPAGTGRMP